MTQIDTTRAKACLSQGGTLEGSLNHVAPWFDAGAFLMALSLDPGRGAAGSTGARAAWLGLVAARIDVLRRQVVQAHDQFDKFCRDGVALPGEGARVDARVASIEKEIAQLMKHMTPRVAAPAKVELPQGRPAKLTDRIIEKAREEAAALLDAVPPPIAPT